MPIIKNNLGRGLRDDMLQYQINNELAADIKAIYDEDTKYYTVQVISKTNGPIGTGFKLNSAGRTIKDITLDAENKQLVFTFTDSLEPATITADLTAIYDEIDTKQDKLTAEDHIKLDGATIKTDIPVYKTPAIPEGTTATKIPFILMAIKSEDGTWSYDWVQCSEALNTGFVYMQQSTDENN